MGVGAVPPSRQKQGQEGIWAIRLIEFRVRQGCLTGTGPWLGWEHVIPVCQRTGWAWRPGFSCSVSGHTLIPGLCMGTAPLPSRGWGCPREDHVGGGLRSALGPAPVILGGGGAGGLNSPAAD